MVFYQILSESDQKLGAAVLAFCCLPKSKGILKLPVVNEHHEVFAIIRGDYFD